MKTYLLKAISYKCFGSFRSIALALEFRSYAIFYLSKIIIRVYKEKGDLAYTPVSILVRYGPSVIVAFLI